jgi:hypothetical protein
MKLYVIQNSAGKFFKPVGYGGYGDQWQTDIEKAKFYTKLGPVKAQCTFWYNANPKLGCPCVLEFNIDPANAKTLSMVEDAQKSAERKAKREAKRQEVYNARMALHNMDKIKQLLPTLTPEQKKALGL